MCPICYQAYSTYLVTQKKYQRQRQRQCTLSSNLLGNDASKSVLATARTMSDCFATTGLGEGSLANNGAALASKKLNTTRADSSLGDRFDDFEAKVNALILHVDAKFVKLLDAKFVEIDAKFVKLDAKFKTLKSSVVFLRNDVTDFRNDIRSVVGLVVWLGLVVGLVFVLLFVVASRLGKMEGGTAYYRTCFPTRVDERAI